MHTATSIAQWVVRLTGVTQLVLGILFWSDRALTLLPLHMLVGMLFVTALWVLAGLAARAGLRTRWVLSAVSWGLVVPTFGMLHPHLLPGPDHWTIRVVHLLIGLVAMVVATKLAAYVHRRRHQAQSTADGALSAA
jgi:uncharacterized membrane protein YczE